MKCDDCKFADWKRTSNGRLHPDKTGKCMVSKDVKLPVSVQAYNLSFEESRQKVFYVRGGWIERGNSFDRCAYYAPVAARGKP